MKDEYDFSKATRGVILPAKRGKTRITIRLDNDILDHFRREVQRKSGGSYQTLINLALRQHMTEASLEKTLRRMVREELARAG